MFHKKNLKDSVKLGGNSLRDPDCNRSRSRNKNNIKRANTDLSDLCGRAWPCGMSPFVFFVCVCCVLQKIGRPQRENRSARELAGRRQIGESASHLADDVD